MRLQWVLVLQLLDPARGPRITIPFPAMEELANHNADVDNANDEAPMLSSKALVALQEFLCKQNQSPADQPEVAGDHGQ